MKNKGYKKIGTINGLNKYEAYIECGYNINGKRKRIHRVHIGTKESAEIWYAQLVQEYYHKGKQINLNDITFRQFSDAFIEEYCQDNVSKITIRNYKQMLKKINEYLGDFKLKQITSSMLENLYKKIKIGTKGNLLSPKTMIHYYNLVGLILNQAVKNKYIESNVNNEVSKPKNEKKERNFYSVEEAQKLLTCLKQENIKYRALITLALDSGARRSEICALRWSDIDFEKHTLLIDNSLKVINGIADEEQAKTESSKRTIYISDSTLEVLKEYKKWQDEYIKEQGTDWQGTDRVFTSRTGSYMHPDTCGKIINKVLTKYNLSKVSFHELRHTSATILLENGISPKATSQRLGHANSKITLEIYAHVFDDTKKASANIINNVLSNN